MRAFAKKVWSKLTGAARAVGRWFDHAFSSLGHAAKAVVAGSGDFLFAVGLYGIGGLTLVVDTFFSLYVYGLRLIYWGYSIGLSVLALLLITPFALLKGREAAATVLHAIARLGLPGVDNAYAAIGVSWSDRAEVPEGMNPVTHFVRTMTGRREAETVEVVTAEADERTETLVSESGISVTITQRDPEQEPKNRPTPRQRKRRPARPHFGLPETA